VTADGDERFEFGRNWQGLVRSLTPEQIEGSVTAMSEVLGVEHLSGSFLDVGSGSGLSSLAAVRLGADRVVSIDLDPNSVAATEELRRRFAVGGERWTVAEGSALDTDLITSLGEFDVVYSWGVLHHTGHQWRALDNVARAVRPGGVLWIALYNDQGWRSDVWRSVKRAYVRQSPAVQGAMVAVAMAWYETKAALRATASGRSPLTPWRERKNQRGMTVYRDWVDWVGGYPFEVTKPDELVAWSLRNDFRLRRLRTVGGGWGCNEYVFDKVDAAGSVPRG
jgi:2-polyprenyl-6-hydroxyphenyl methylase/3-demethylubiquinone-9 3-methyltransferase